MNLKEFNKGILFSSLGSFWWGAIGVIYFSYFSFIGHIELVIHRCIWTAVMLIITTQFFSKWNIFFKILKDKKNINNFEYINQWTSCLQNSYNNIPNDLSETEKITFFEQENIKQSIKNLREYDFIDKLINENKLNVIGLWYQINSGLIKFLDKNNSFIDLD